MCLSTNLAKQTRQVAPLLPPLFLHSSPPTHADLQISAHIPLSPALTCIPVYLSLTDLRNLTQCPATKLTHLVHVDVCVGHVYRS
ncbi:hypothetical protein CC86DRAFT_151397 [Ophiobolus disseminans]|uniref:Uncharacterized protein n=1 Tax=Ophiobolus disseminans TaxID=1469910 RepID=A0A6A6ZCT3_9PLEO|nr:hypothetical protein CC86DRAFT_151397 [Ophiobolus disseminans]